MKNKKIYIAGHKGMVGSAITRVFEKNGYTNIITRSFEELDLTDQAKTRFFFEQEKPEIVIVAAAKVGGIMANNTYRAEFIYDNLMIEANIIDSAYRNSCEKLVFLGSSCIYPKLAGQPMNENELLTGILEYTNEPYAIAKIAGIKLCENYYKQYGCNYYSLMPTNLYGPFDNYNLETSHVIPALIRKFHEAKINNLSSVTVWGTGKPMREFLYVEDLAEAVRFVTENINAADLYDNGITHLNVGSGTDLSIKELAEKIKQITEFAGEIIFDSSKPDGTPKKLLDVTRINNLGWKYTTGLEEGLAKAYRWFIDNY